ncbi:hypothetical protein ACVXG7_25585 [Enterobacter hormaechei]
MEPRRQFLRYSPQSACVRHHPYATDQSFAKIAVNINGVHRQPYAIFRKLKIVETDMMAIIQVMMQVIIPSQSNSVGNGNRPSGLPSASQPKGIKLTREAPGH